MMPYASCTFKSRKLVKLGCRDLAASVKVIVEIKELVDSNYSFVCCQLFLFHQVLFHIEKHVGDTC